LFAREEFFLYHLKQQGAIIEFFLVLNFFKGGYFLEGRVRDERGVTFIFFFFQIVDFYFWLLLFVKEQAGSIVGLCFLKFCLFYHRPNCLLYWNQISPYFFEGSDQLRHQPISFLQGNIPLRTSVRCRFSLYVLTEICHQKSKLLGQ